MSLSLCFPDNEKSCFACCPPIRPAGYEHIHYRTIIMRILRENSRDIHRRKETPSPITGFSCWALGYVLGDYKVVGCLLHPAQNRGVDLRYRTGYGDKCRRETCQEERIFSLLRGFEKKFWLQLSAGLDSFAYSSREINPLFRMLEWGVNILRLIAEREYSWTFSREAFFQSYPFFRTKLAPRANAYLINRVVSAAGTAPLTRMDFTDMFNAFSTLIVKRLLGKYRSMHEGKYTHLLDIDPLFSDFLRLSAGIVKTTLNYAIDMKDMVDEEVEGFMKKRA